MFRGRLGDGEVMGRSVLEESPIDNEDIAGSGEGWCRCGSSGGGCWGGNSDSCGNWPKVVAGYDASGIRLTGESGDEDGDGSDRGDESVVESVVVGEESADSDACVEVLSWCLWVGSAGTALD
jgi:hypothetical protein